jgi:cytochrome P450
LAAININDFEQLNSIGYLEAIIYETMRLVPTIVMLIPRKVLKNCIIGGLKIRKGDYVGIDACINSFDEKIFENPFEFRPERFLDSNGKFVLPIDPFLIN